MSGRRLDRCRRSTHSRWACAPGSGRCAPHTAHPRWRNWSPARVLKDGRHALRRRREGRHRPHRAGQGAVFLLANRGDFQPCAHPRPDLLAMFRRHTDDRLKPASAVSTFSTSVDWMTNCPWETVSSVTRSVSGASTSLFSANWACRSRTLRSASARLCCSALTSRSASMRALSRSASISVRWARAPLAASSALAISDRVCSTRSSVARFCERSFSRICNWLRSRSSRAPVNASTCWQAARRCVALASARSSAVPGRPAA